MIQAVYFKNKLFYLINTHTWTVIWSSSRGNLFKVNYNFMSKDMLPYSSYEFKTPTTKQLEILSDMEILELL